MAARTFAQIVAKDSPAVDDVHIGGGGSRRPRRAKTTIVSDAEEDFNKADLADQLVRHHKKTAKLHHEMGRHIHNGGLLIGMLRPSQPPEDEAPGSPESIAEGDAQPVSMRHVGTLKIAKVQEDERVVFGWASVVTKGGRLIIDKQGDAIEPSALEAAAYDYMLESRRHGHMHETVFEDGAIVESMVFTTEKQKALGIDLGQEGWWVGYYVKNDDVWAAIKSGKLPEFSIGGLGVAVDYTE